MCLEKYLIFSKQYQQYLSRFEDQNALSQFASSDNIIILEDLGKVIRESCEDIFQGSCWFYLLIPNNNISKTVIYFLQYLYLLNNSSSLQSYSSLNKFFFIEKLDTIYTTVLKSFCFIVNPRMILVLYPHLYTSKSTYY